MGVNDSCTTSFDTKFVGSWIDDDCETYECFFHSTDTQVIGADGTWTNNYQTDGYAWWDQGDGLLLKRMKADDATDDTEDHYATLDGDVLNITRMSDGKTYTLSKVE